MKNFLIVQRVCNRATNFFLFQGQSREAPSTILLCANLVFSVPSKNSANACVDTAVVPVAIVASIDRDVIFVSIPVLRNLAHKKRMRYLCLVPWLRCWC